MTCLTKSFKVRVLFACEEHPYGCENYVVLAPNEQVAKDKALRLSYESPLADPRIDFICVARVVDSFANPEEE